MTESPEIATSGAESRLPAGAGELLRQAREAAGLHIAALAVMLKVPVKKLEALEGNRFDLLPDAVFVRALAASVCRTLKIDPGPILAQLPATSSPKLTYQGACLNETFRSPGDAPGPSMWMQLSRPAVLAGLVLLLGALVLVFLPAIKAGILDVNASVVDSSLAGLATNEAQRQSDSAALLKPGSQHALSEAGSIKPTDGSSNAAAVTSAPTTFSVSASSPAPISDSKALTPRASPGTSSPTFVINASPPPSTDIVLFTAKGESWVEATDAKGQVVLRRMLAAGEVVGAAGSLPLKVTVGRANMTQVQIRGKGFDLTPVSKDNVARFEVK